MTGGVVSGTWRLDDARVVVDWFGAAGRPPGAALTEEVARLAEIHGRPLEVQLVVA